MYYFNGGLTFIHCFTYYNSVADYVIVVYAKLLTPVLKSNCP
jgi:hypothetical protein